MAIAGRWYDAGFHRGSELRGIGSASVDLVAGSVDDCRFPARWRSNQSLFQRLGTSGWAPTQIRDQSPVTAVTRASVIHHDPFAFTGMIAHGPIPSFTRQGSYSCACSPGSDVESVRQRLQQTSPTSSLRERVSQPQAEAFGVRDRAEPPLFAAPLRGVIRHPSLSTNIYSRPRIIWTIRHIARHRIVRQIIYMSSLEALPAPS